MVPEIWYLISNVQPHATHAYAKEWASNEQFITIDQPESAALFRNISFLF